MSPRRPAPTAVQRAIREGYGRSGTATGVPREIEEDEPSIPANLTHDAAVVYRLQRLEANDIELAHGLGDVRKDVIVMSTELKALVAFAAKADEREERADQAMIAADRAERAAALAADAQVQAAALTAKAAETTARSVDKTSERALETAKLTSREKIYLAIIAVISSAIVGYLALSNLAIK